MIKGLRDTSLTNILNQMASSSVSQKKINNLICSQCNKTFKHPNSIYNHRRSCTSLSRLVPEGRKKKMDLCVEIKISNDNNKEKKRKYKMEKVNCDICDKSVSKGNLSTHKKTHQNIAKNNIPVKPMVVSLEETFNFLCWLSQSQQYTINTLEEFQDAFDIYKTISPIIKDDKVIINLNFDDIIQDQELDDEIQDQEIQNEIKEQEINDEIQDQELNNEIQEPSPNDNEIQDQEINNEIQDQEINNEIQEPSPNDNEPTPEENIIISIIEPNDARAQELLENENIFEEDKELEYYSDEYSFFEVSKKDNKRIYHCIKPYTSEHCFLKVNKFLERFDKRKLKEYELEDLKNCQESIIKIKHPLNLLRRLTEDEIYDNSTPKLIDNNFLTRTLFTAIKSKYKELEYTENRYDKNEYLNKIWKDLNDAKDNIPKFMEKKWKLMEKNNK
jgi:hypothetical protein